jgi:hypothetical protein
MIVGNGLIAKAFNNYDKEEYIFFCSGVSDSKSISDDGFLREANLLKKVISEADKEQCIIYLSTCSIDDDYLKDSPYVTHKRAMERLLATSAACYLVVRTSNVVGQHANNKTIFSYLVNKIRSGEPFELWVNAVRNFIDVDHLTAFIDRYLQDGAKNTVIQLPGPEKLNVLEIVNKIEEYFQMKGNYTIAYKGYDIVYDTSMVIALNDEMRLLTYPYFDYLLSKYYG